MLDVLLILTKKCNLKCAHCCDDCGPKGETIEQHVLDAVMRHLPKHEPGEITITGGEPFIEKSKLYSTIDAITGSGRRGVINIQTNGFWTMNEQQAYDTLRRLGMRDISVIITSRDEFHNTRGLATGRISLKEGSAAYNALKRIADETGGFFLPKNTEMPGVPAIMARKGKMLAVLAPLPDTRVYPFGRAKSLGAWHYAQESKCQAMAFNSPNRLITITPDGNAYPCCWHATPPIGSAIESPLEELVQNMRRDPVFRMLIRNGLGETAKLLGTYKAEDAEAYEKNPCSKCEEAFGGQNV